MVGPLITPDGIGNITAGDRQISFYLEYDRGTENHHRLENKIDRYRVVGRTGRGLDALCSYFRAPPGSARRGARSRALASRSPRLSATTCSAIRSGWCGCPWVTTDAG